MSNKKGLDLIILIVNLLGVVLAVAAAIFTIARKAENSFLLITALLTILALLAALFYFLKGAGKNAAGFFKLFMSFYALAEFCSIISASGLTVNQPAAIAVSAAIFALLILLAAGTDLGKTKSVLICVGILVLSVISLAGAIILFGGTPLGLVLTLRAAANLVLAVLTGIMVIAKYVDKTRRGTT